VLLATNAIGVCSAGMRPILRDGEHRAYASDPCEDPFALSVAAGTSAVEAHSRAALRLRRCTPALSSNGVLERLQQEVANPAAHPLALHCTSSTENRRMLRIIAASIGTAVTASAS